MGVGAIEIFLLQGKGKGPATCPYKLSSPKSVLKGVIGKGNVLWTNKWGLLNISAEHIRAYNVVLTQESRGCWRSLAFPTFTAPQNFSIMEDFVELVGNPVSSSPSIL